MKVLFVSNVYPTEEGKGTPSIKIQKEILESMGVEVDVYPIETGNIIEYVKAALFFLFGGFKIREYDLIHAFYGLSGVAAVLQRKVPVVATFLGSDILAEGLHNDRDRRFSMLAVRRAKAVIMMSDEMKRSAGREDAYVIPFGVHLPDFQLEERDIARKKLGLSSEKKYVLFPWDPKRAVKRYDLAKTAVQLAQKKIPEAELLVIYNNKHQEVVDYMNACDVILMTSDHEGSPVAIREAMAVNLPVVSVDVGDVAELVAGVDNCYIVTQDVAAISEGLTKVLLIGKRSNGRGKMGAYDMINATEQVYKIYQTMLEQS